MKYNKQNEKIELITEESLVIGIDVGSEKHYARAFNNRGIEFSKKPFAFENSRSGFETFKCWVEQYIAMTGKSKVFVGMEPTGHYWFNLGRYVHENGMILVHVNPAAVKHSKELDDNNPSKNDRKDPKVIAGLVKDGRYSFPYMPEGIYADLRELSNYRSETVEEQTRWKNRMARWFSIYFPEFKDVYRNVDSVSGMMILEEYPLPEDIVALGVEGINRIWRDRKVRGAGMKRAQKLVDAASRSIGHKAASEVARIEFKNILKHLRDCKERLEEIMTLVSEKLPEVPNVDKLLAIPGVGEANVLTFVAEVGDITRFDDPKEIQKLSGLAIVEDSSGKHNGESKISYRGRKRLRYMLYKQALLLVSNNSEFKEIHEYYTKRETNPLKKIQSIVAVSCKVIRVFYKILTTGVDYDGNKMSSDIIRPQAQALEAA